MVMNLWLPGSSASSAKSYNKEALSRKADTHNLDNARNYGISPGYAALQYTQHADSVLPRFGEMGYAPMARFGPILESLYWSGFDHQRQAWYADSVICFRYYTGGPAWSPLFFVPYPAPMPSAFCELTPERYQDRTLNKLLCGQLYEMEFLPGQCEPN